MFKDEYSYDEIDRYQDKFYVACQNLKDQVALHRHQKGQIVVVMDGVASLDVENSQYVIPYGYFVWIPENVMHRVSFNGKMVTLLSVYYPAEVRRPEMFNEVGVYPIPSILYHVIEIMKESSNSFGREDWRFELLETTIHILPHIIADCHFKLRLPTTTNRTALRIIECIHKDYFKPVTLQHISRNLGLSERSVNRYMNHELGMSFTQYLRTYRIMKAIRRMADSDESLSNIAYEVGYDSLTAFSNTFNKITGMRPSQFFRQPDIEWPE